jgi:pimeloyl-ACP methyl ester carboxylesterase
MRHKPWHGQRVATDSPVRASDIIGVGRLAFDAALGLTDVVEAMHGTIVRRPLPVGTVADTRTRGITRFVYQSIRTTTRVVGGGLDAALALLSSRAAATTSSPRRDVAIAVLNGVIGDHLAATHNPLETPMALRLVGEPRRRVLVLAHGLCMSDQQWSRRGHDHGEALAHDHGFSPLYLRYNSGRHVSLNGRELASALETQLAAWPVPIDEIVLLGHSMGGLVLRSACYYAHLAGHRWMAQLTRLVCLGTPHHGAPLERAGNLLELLLDVSPYAAPLARIGGNRSAGITDLRFGNICEDDWAERSRRDRADLRVPVPLPEGIACFAVAATRGRKDGDAGDRLLGDGLVTVASALGRHADPQFTLAFPPSHQRVVYEHSHFDLLDSQVVYAQLAAWLGAQS